MDTKTVNVDVTAEDISAAFREADLYGRARGCPVARALRRALGFSLEAGVWDEVLVAPHVAMVRGYEDVRLPYHVLEFISIFDRQTCSSRLLDVKPISFTVVLEPKQLDILVQCQLQLGF